MTRDWDAEWAAIEAEYHAAKKALTAAFGPVSPDPAMGSKQVVTEALATFGAANQRFETAKSRWSDFLAERKRHDPTWAQ
jgi:cytochrome c peroxidase